MEKECLRAHDFEAFDGLSWQPLNLMFKEECDLNDIEVSLLWTGFLEARLPSGLTLFFAPGEWQRVSAS